jgi:hypothetical protein
MTGRLSLRVGALAALAVALCSLAVWAPPASALSARFLVNGGDTYSRTPRVTVGDAGWSPFFRPGVMVWDGGSIVAGHRADPGYAFPVQTLSVLPRACESFISSSPSAKIADMLADAPFEVDARYRANADLNVCVVLAGGGDFRLGASAASVYSALRTYCQERRDAGFRVVVLSVLPSSRPVTFEATRLAYNTMLRDGWSQFADGLGDLAGDLRIGDTGDQLDRQFFLSDELHLTNAGNAVMAAVTAPVLNALPWNSARCEMRLRDLPGEWTDWRPWTAQKSIWLGDYEGEHVVEAEYRLDGGEPVSVSDSVFLDTVRPAPRVLRDAVVRRGARAALRYRVEDAEPCGPTSTVTVTLKTLSGSVVKTFVRRLVPVNEPEAVTFTCTLPKGTYRWVVQARDAAGNVDAGPAQGRLVVRARR